MKKAEGPYESARRRGEPVPGSLRAAVEEGLLLPDYYAPVQNMLVTRAGGLWLRETATTDVHDGQWVALGPDGRGGVPCDGSRGRRLQGHRRGQDLGHEYQRTRCAVHPAIRIGPAGRLRVPGPVGDVSAETLLVLRFAANRTTFPPMSNFSLKLPDDMYAALAAEARRRNITRVRPGAGDDRPERSSTTPARRHPDCAQLAGDLVGGFRSGRRDLATDERLLEEALISDADRNAPDRPSLTRAPIVALLDGDEARHDWARSQFESAASTPAHLRSRPLGGIVPAAARRGGSGPPGEARAAGRSRGRRSLRLGVRTRTPLRA